MGVEVSVGQSHYRGTSLRASARICVTAFERFLSCLEKYIYPVSNVSTNISFNLAQRFKVEEWNNWQYLLYLLIGW